MLSLPWNLMVILGAIFTVTCSMVGCYPVEDKIQSLPGQPQVTFQQFAGYVTIDDKHQRSLFYYFVEAETNPASKPLVLWLNGGPGCSSLIGAFLEHGPFIASAKGVVTNAYSWNRVANMLYLESPAGVGFSYSANNSIYASYNDDIAARQNLAFLQRWFLKFPEYKNRDFYITGESYGGHYVPQLAQLIIETKAIPNLKGIAIGNPLLDFETDLDARVDYYWSHGLISDSTYQTMIRECNGSEYMRQALIKKNVSDTCAELYNIVQYQLKLIDINNVLRERCEPSNSSTAAILTHPPSSSLRASMVSQLLQPFASNRQGDEDVCGLALTSKYLNRKDVQTVLHARLVGVNTWDYCNKVVSTKYDGASLEIATIKVVGSLVRSGIRVVVYSGDQDSNIPFIGTRRLVSELAEELKLEVTVPHLPWLVGKQIGGWTEVYGEGLTYAVIRGASHEAPATQPKRALVLFNAFVQGEVLPIPQFPQG